MIRGYNDYFVEPKPKKLSHAAIALIIISIVFVVGIVIVIASIELFGIVENTGEWAKESFDSMTELTVEDMTEISSYDLEDIDTVRVDSDAICVKVVPSEDDQLHVWSSGNGFTPKVSKEGKSIVINANEEGTVIQFHFNTKNIEDKLGGVYVEVPKQAEQLKFEYKMDAGKVLMDGVSVDALSFDTDASNITLKNVTANKLDLKEDAGAVKLENCEVAKFGAKVVVTAIKAIDTSFEQVDIENDAGAIDLETAEGVDCYGFDIRTDLAVVKIGLSKSPKTGADPN